MISMASIWDDFGTSSKSETIKGETSWWGSPNESYTVTEGIFGGKSVSDSSGNDVGSLGTSWTGATTFTDSNGHTETVDSGTYFSNNTVTASYLDGRVGSANVAKSSTSSSSSNYGDSSGLSSSSSSGTYGGGGYGGGYGGGSSSAKVNWKPYAWGIGIILVILNLPLVIIGLCVVAGIALAIGVIGALFKG